MQHLVSREGMPGMYSEMPDKPQTFALLRAAEDQNSGTTGLYASVTR
jgi:hypothetical protein